MKYIVILLMLGLFAAGGWFTWQKLEAEKQTNSGIAANTVAEVKAETIEEQILLTGIVAPVISTEVRSEITGRIQTIHVEDGAEVEAGQLLIDLEKKDRETDVQEAERNYQAQQLRVENARRKLNRNKELFASGYINESDFHDSETDLKIAEIELEVRQARLDRALEALTKTAVTAPHAGMVSNLDLNPGQVIVGAESVNSGTRLMIVSDPSMLYVDTEVNELDVTRVSVGMPAVVTFDALPKLKFDAVITRIAGYAERDNQERVFPVRISFSAGEHAVKKGISANIVLPISRVENVPSVSLAAVFRKLRGNDFVYLKTGENTFIEREVATGLRDAFRVEIKEGLKVGDVVSLVRPDNIVKEGE